MEPQNIPLLMPSTVKLGIKIYMVKHSFEVYNCWRIMKKVGFYTDSIYDYNTVMSD